MYIQELQWMLKLSFKFTGRSIYIFYFKVGIAIHEMLHALGQWHEQSRTDRDNHLNMRWDILGMSKQGGANYGKFDTRDYYPYDYESIMQYSAGVHIYLSLCLIFLIFILIVSYFIKYIE